MLCSHKFFLSCLWNIFRYPLKNFSNFKFRILDMIAVCCHFAYSFKIMRIPQPGIPEVFPPRSVRYLCSGGGGGIDVAYIRCIKSREPEVFELWDFTEELVREIHPYAWIQISNDFVRENFYSHFFNAQEIRIPFLGR